MFSYGSDEETARYVTWDVHRTLEDARSFIDFVLHRYEQKAVAPWAIEHKDSGKMIGTIDFVSWQPQHKTAEIGYVLAKDYWEQGLGTEAAKELLRFGFSRMDLVRIQAKCFAENLGSERIMQKIGMSYEGTLRKSMYMKGKHQDLKMYAIVREEFLPQGI